MPAARTSAAGTVAVNQFPVITTGSIGKWAYQGVAADRWLFFQRLNLFMPSGFKKRDRFGNVPNVILVIVVIWTNWHSLGESEVVGRLGRITADDPKAQSGKPAATFAGTDAEHFAEFRQLRIFRIDHDFPFSGSF